MAPFALPGNHSARSWTLVSRKPVPRGSQQRISEAQAHTLLWFQLYSSCIRIFIHRIFSKLIPSHHFNHLPMPLSHLFTSSFISIVDLYPSPDWIWAPLPGDRGQGSAQIQSFQWSSLDSQAFSVTVPLLQFIHTLSFPPLLCIGRWHLLFSFVPTHKGIALVAGVSLICYQMREGISRPSPCPSHTSLSVYLIVSPALDWTEQG